MKLIVTILAFAAITIPNFSQNIHSGKIIFKETIKLNFDLGDDNPQMAKMMPASQSVDKVLYFTKDESLYKNHENPKDLELKHEEGGGTFEIVMKIPESIIYINPVENTFIQSQDLMGKDFLITDKLPKNKWKMTGEQKSILNYPCQKAILQDTSKNVVAWFTPQIPVNFGPSGMTGLPGMILALETDNGDRMTIATSIDNLPESFQFTRPTKGKKVSKAEYEKIREAKMKEMGATDGKNGSIKMIITEERH
ncbi:MAG: GLPGLI family protein [Saprospiraceae bacterium]|nr:GLPGLI family protein [Saprospiraceae bacterium]